MSAAATALLHCSITATLLLFIIAGCGEHDNNPGWGGDNNNANYGEHDTNAVKVVQIIPDSGTWIAPETQFTVRFDRPIIPNSGSITFGGYTFKLPYPDPSDTITWNRCFAVFIPLGEQAQLIVCDFQDIAGHIQAEPFSASYPASVVDPGPATIIGHEPSGSRVNPVTTRAIRITVSRPLDQADFQITPTLTGTLEIDNDRIQCESVVRWNFLTGERLQEATEYLVVVELKDFVGNRSTEYFTFTTQ